VGGTRRGEDLRDKEYWEENGKEKKSNEGKNPPVTENDFGYQKVPMASGRKGGAANHKGLNLGLGGGRLRGLRAVVKSN